MICSKMLGVVYETNDRTYARNISGSGKTHNKYYVHGDKKSAFEELDGKKFGACSTHRCRESAEVTAHVWVNGHEGAFLTPLCRRCNNPNNYMEFRLKKKSPIIPLVKINNFIIKTNPIFNPLVDSKTV